MAGRYRVLSFDGGGIRGLLTARLLERLEAADPRLVANMDLLAGTSAGGVLALGLAAGLTPGAIGAIYRDHGGEIFARDEWGHLDKLVRADYRNGPLEGTLREVFGEKVLGDLKKKVLVAAFDLDSVVVTKAGVRTWKAKFFHNFPEPNGLDDLDQRVVDVAMRTSAAPTYFPTYQGFVDGGVVANNPSMCALAQALDPKTGHQRLRDVWLLSLGTGANPDFIEGDDEDWGLEQWALRLVPMLLGGDTGLADFQSRQVLGERYMRLDPVLPERIGLDSADSIALLDRVAEAVEIEDAVDWLGRCLRDLGKILPSPRTMEGATMTEDSDATDFWDEDEAEVRAAATQPPESESILKNDPSAITWSVDIPYSNRFERRTNLHWALGFGAIAAIFLVPAVIELVRLRDLGALLFLAGMLSAVAALVFVVVRVSGNKAHDGTFCVTDEGVRYTPGKSERRLALMSAAMGGAAGRPSAVNVAASGAAPRMALWRNVTRATAYPDDRVIDLHGRIGGPLHVYCSEDVYDAVLEAASAHVLVADGLLK